MLFYLKFYAESKYGQEKMYPFYKTRFGYFDFRQILLKQFRTDAILPKILCRIQIWASKIGLPTGQMTSVKNSVFNFFLEIYIDVAVIKSYNY